MPRPKILQTLKIALSCCLALSAAASQEYDWAAIDEEAFEKVQPTTRIMDAIGIKPGMFVGEVGAGGGRVAVRVARIVGPGGRVFANDITESALAYMRERLRRDKIENVEVVRGTVTDPRFPKGMLDAVYMTYTYRHLDAPAEVLSNVAPALKPDGVLAVIDSKSYNRDPATNPIIKNAEKSGFSLAKLETFLPEDDIYLFRIAAQSGFAPAAGALPLGQLPAGMSPDAVEFTAAELYVLDRGTVSVFALPGLSLLRSFVVRGAGEGKLSPNHHFDQALRVLGDRIWLEDGRKLVVYSTSGQFVSEKRKPQNSVWFLPAGDGFVAKSMVLEGDPRIQYIRVVLYDAELREIKELYRQKWFQQQDAKGFSTELLGDLLHFAVVDDRICVEESPKGFFIEQFDPAGNRVGAIEKPIRGVPVTPGDREREMALVRTEKRVALMIGRTGSWEKLKEIWTITFPERTPALRELQACGDLLLVRTFERRGDAERYLLIDLDGTVRKDVFLPLVSDAETEARVSGTAFFRLIGDRFYYLKHDEASDRWEVRRTGL